MQKNPLYQWLRKENLWLTTCPPSPSHVFLDGGKALVSEDRYDDFILEYTKCISANIPQFAVERVSPLAFTMFVDLDLPTGVDHKSIAAIVAKTVHNVLEYGKGTVIVCMKPDIETKGGLHLIWEGCVVDKDTALCARSETIDRLVDVDLCSCPWEKAYDGSLYGGTGMRMLYAKKKDGSPGQEYIPCAIISFDPEENNKNGIWQSIDPPDIQNRDEITSWLQRCRLRPSPVTIQQSVVSTLKISRPLVNSSKAKHTQLSTTELSQLMDQIPESYMPFQITSVSKIDDAYVISTTSRYCANLGRCHRSNHVYFLASTRGIFQKCYCTCDTTEGRKHGKCESFCQRISDPPKFLSCDSWLSANKLSRSSLLLRQLKLFGDMSVP
jgi:hypothetical protein